MGDVDFLSGLGDQDRDDEDEEKKVNFAQKLKRDTFRGLPDFSHYSIWHQDFQNPRLYLS